MDRDPVHLKEMLRRTHKHKGSSFLEIYQNCNVFNDGAFFIYTDKETKKKEVLFLEQDKPLIFGEQNEKGITLDGLTPKVVHLTEGHSANDLWIHNEADRSKALILSRFFDDPANGDHLPRPFGVFFQEERACYEDNLNAQILHEQHKKGTGDLSALLRGRETWTIL